MTDPAGIVNDRGRSNDATSLDDVRRPALRSLILAATRQGVPPPR